MKYKTKKNRANLYRIAAEIVDNTTNDKLIYEILISLGETDLNIDFLDSKFCCDIIAGLTGYKYHSDVEVKMFPEFFLFCPVGKQQEGFTGWWDDNDRQTRATAFLLAAEMCEN
jgi:hypothetical protein